MESGEVHISSMVVHASPDGLQSVKHKIEALPGVEIHGESANGKLVVVLESEHESHITDTIDEIRSLDHVLNTVLVYHQIEQSESTETEPS